jgi:3-phenylpropionate/cinnamic acid dioxygenase small subunit
MLSDSGGDMEQLAELYGVRMREIARLQEGYVSKETEWRRLRERLEHRVIQLEAEKSAAQISSSQAQHLLGESTLTINLRVKFCRNFFSQHLSFCFIFLHN